MKPVFNDPNVEETFRKNGFVILPLISTEEAAELKEKLLQLSPSDNFKGNQNTLIGQQSFHITFFDTNTDYKTRVFDFVKNYFSQHAKTILNGYTCVQANVFLKPPGAGFVYPHQNITITNERKFTSVSFWLPLQDTTFENGTVCLIPGSHNHFVKYRNTHIYWPYVKFFKEGPGLDYFVPINVRAGEILILDDRIVHYTPVNKSESGRWVVHSLWAPAEAELYFCDPDKTEVKIFKTGGQFWQFHAPGSLLNDRSPDYILPNDEIFYSEEQLTEILEKLKHAYESKG